MIRGATIRIGLSLVGLFLGMTVLSFIWTPYDPLAIDAERSLAPVSLRHPLGTDMLGRDVLSNLIVGARATLLVAVLAVAITMIVGVSAGIAAALIGRRTRAVLTFLIDIVLALPGVLVAIVLVVLAPGRHGVSVGVPGGRCSVGTVVRRRRAAQLERPARPAA